MNKRKLKHELKNTQQTLKFFETLLRASTDGVVITDATQNIVMVNEAFCAFFGRRWRDVVETSLFAWLEQLAADAPQRWAALEQRAILDGVCQDTEFRMNAKDGVRHLMVNASRLERIANEEAGAIISIWRDETKRIRAEKALREEGLMQKNAFIENILRSSVEFAIAATDTDFRIIHYNHVAEKLFGYPAKEVIGRTVTEMLHREKISPFRFERSMEIVRREGEYRYNSTRKKEDRVHYIESRISAILDKNKVIIGFLLVSNDITKHKLAEETLRQAKDQAEFANSAKSEFLACMSHEIRTPLNAVLGFSELLSALITDKRQRNYLASIRSAGKSLLTLINDILDISQIEAGKLKMEYEALNPHLFLSEIKELFEPKISAKGLRFIIDIDESLPPTLMLDESRLRQVLFNLIGNAVKFTEKGYIKLSAKHRIISEHRMDFVLSVEDSGVGIPEDQQKVIFESFRQQDSHNTRKYGGTGLGLAISKRLAEIMNGQISVKSKAGAGSIFEVLLREVDISVAEPETGYPREKPSDRKNIELEKGQELFVDDVDRTAYVEKEGAGSAAPAFNEFIPENIAMLPALVYTLRQEMLPICQELNCVVDIDMIEDFTGRLKELGKECKCPGLVEYAGNLWEAAQYFDIEKIGAFLEEFPKILEILASGQNKER
ncbi:MAG: PAS domain S-box protein [Gammaproteobacteria bacterium]|nr:PAS domain S-box protein [Gammaproteobacteria bacterium]